MATWYRENYKVWLDSGCLPDNEVTHLNLYNNQLTSIPPEICQLQNLTHLYLNNNQLMSIPPEIGQLSNLQDLYLYDNQLTSLPSEVGKLQNLTHLYLYNNQLTSLPSEIGQLQNLMYLIINNNQLTSIPPEIGQLQNLTHLDIYTNQLTSIPPEIGQLQNLNNLYIQNNPIEHIPLNVQRLLQRQRVINQGIYADTQSVHNSSIQTSLKESILRILKEKIVEKDVVPLILSDSVLTPFTKESLIEYSRDESVHSVLNLTFSDLLLIVCSIVFSRSSCQVKKSPIAVIAFSLLVKWLGIDTMITLKFCISFCTEGVNDIFIRIFIF